MSKLNTQWRVSQETDWASRGRGGASDRCRLSAYTLVEKLQTISTKYRRQRADGSMPQNFLRH